MFDKFVLENREYQQKAVQQTLDFYARGKESVLIESPVGSGKTIMGLLVIKALQEENPNLKVNWVASRKHILGQTDRVNQEFFHCNINLVSVFNDNPPPADMVVLDEAHHEATQSCLNMYEKTRNRLTLGLSATPLRTDKMRLSFQETVRTCSIQTLIKQGVLSKYCSYKLPYWNVDLAAKVYCQSPEKWGKTLVFFNTLAECRAFSEELNSRGIPCEVVSSNSRRDRQLDLFINGDLQVIANVSVLSEGFDLPELQSVFIRDGSRLPVIQMAGRGLRKAPGKKFCNIVQSEQSVYQCEKIAEPQESFKYVRDCFLACSDNTEAIINALSLSVELLEKREQPRLPHYISTAPGKLWVSLANRRMKYRR